MPANRIYLFCKDGPNHGEFEVLGYQYDKRLLEAEVERREFEDYTEDRKAWLEAGENPKFGPIAPENREYRKYFVKEVEELKV